MRGNPVLLAAIAAIICIPVLFAALGGSRQAGLAIGVVLVVAGVLVGLRDRGDPS
jgi:hypothetical protein